VADPSVSCPSLPGPQSAILACISHPLSPGTFTSRSWLLAHAPPWRRYPSLGTPFGVWTSPIGERYFTPASSPCSLTAPRSGSQMPLPSVSFTPCRWHRTRRVVRLADASARPLLTPSRHPSRSLHATLPTYPLYLPPRTSSPFFPPSYGNLVQPFVALAPHLPSPFLPHDVG
jgi:hypothetical protein